MKKPDIITRLNAAACMLNDYEQHNDCPEEVFGDRTAADACDDAASIILQLVDALENAADALDAYSGGMASELENINKAIAKVTAADQ